MGRGVRGVVQDKRMAYTTAITKKCKAKVEPVLSSTSPRFILPLETALSFTISVSFWFDVPPVSRDSKVTQKVTEKRRPTSQNDVS